jgi:predicted hotdog family 3-hydroxylacyl-ACP dehydratase
MRFVDKAVSLDMQEKSGVFSMILDVKKPYFSGGTLQSVWLLEMLAQAAAGVFHWSRLHDKKDESPALGFLVGLENFTVFDGVSHLAAGMELRLEARLTYDFFPFGVYTCSAYWRENLLATGDFKFITQEEGV